MVGDIFAPKRICGHEFFLPVMVFSLFVLIKYLTLFSINFGPILFFDELLYKELALKLVTEPLKNGYPSTHFPFVYPLFLSPAFLFSDFYSVMKILNILYSSAIVFPVWMIARLFKLGHTESVIVIVLASLLPYQVALSPMIMSELLFFPLLYFAIYLTLQMPARRRIAFAYLTGIFIGLLVETRYIAIPLVPSFLFVFSLKLLEKSHGEARHDKFKQLFSLLLGFATVYLPRLGVGLLLGHKIFSVVGFATHKVMVETDLNRILLFHTFYVSYIILSFAPYLFWLLFFGSKYLAPPWTSPEKRLFILIMAITATLVSVASWHSAKAYYNTPDLKYMIGRYVFFSLPLVIVFTFAGLKNSCVVKRKGTALSIGSLWLSALTSTLLIMFSYKILFENYLIDLPGYFVMSHISPDGTAWRLLKYPYMYTVLGVIVLYALYVTVKWPPKALPWLVFIVTVSLCLWGNKVLYKQTVEYKRRAIHAYYLAEGAKAFFKRTGIVPDIYSIKFPHSFIEHSFKFWEAPINKVIFLGEETQFTSPGVLLDTKQAAHYPLVHSYQTGGKQYFIQHIIERENR
jgi:hypothetical protein